MFPFPKRQSGIDLPEFDATDIWFAPGAAINSTEAFNHATKLEARAYVANRWLFVAIMVVLIFFVTVQMPHAWIRWRWAEKWYWGFNILPAHTARSPNSRDDANPPRRLRHFPALVPAYTVPLFSLPLGEFIVVLVLWIVSASVAGWCQAAFLTDASRSTLVIMALMSLTAALGVKAGGVGTWVSYGYTAVNFLHRWTGRLVLLLTTLHVVAYLVIFYMDGVAQEQMKKSANYLGAVSYGGICLAGLASIRPIRRRSWLLFKFGHHLGILLLLAGLNYHSPDIVPYLLAIWVLIIANTFIRSITTHRIISPVLTPLPGADSTLITIPAYNHGFFPGQHVRIRMLTGFGWKGLLESHPFTIASADGGDGLEMIVKRAGNWTERLHEVALRGEKVRCTIEGPYGGPINFLFPAFGSVLVVAGGSGISFAIGVTRGLLADIRLGRAACKSLTLVWTVRSRENLEALSPLLMGLLRDAQALEKAQPDFQLHLILCHTARIEKALHIEDKGEVIQFIAPPASPASPPLASDPDSEPSPTAPTHVLGPVPESDKETQNEKEAEDVDSHAVGPAPARHKSKSRRNPDIPSRITSLPASTAVPPPQTLSDFSASSSSACRVTVLASRPDLPTILSDVISSTKDGTGVGVGACGPARMVGDVERMVQRISRRKGEGKRVGGVEFHAERFSL